MEPLVLLLDGAVTLPCETSFKLVTDCSIPENDQIRRILSNKAFDRARLVNALGSNFD